MSEESPTRRLSQIFGSLSGLTELKSSLDPQNHPNGHGTTNNHQHLFGFANASTSTTVSPTPSSKSQHSAPSASSPRLSGQFNSSTPSALALSVARNVAMGSRSTPNSPRLMPKRSRAPPTVPQRPSAAIIANPALMALDAEAPWPHFSTLTDHLDVHQVNNYSQGLPEINWQERCLELQLELHRSKNQAGRIREMLRDKVRKK